MELDEEEKDVKECYFKNNKSTRNRIVKHLDTKVSKYLRPSIRLSQVPKEKKL